MLQPRLVFLLALLLTIPTAAALPTPPDPDSDGDGLSDFHEIHKHRTDPRDADSDGDGTPDGDWDERREFNYSLRSVIQVMPPVSEDALVDDYQDGRVLSRGENYLVLEVVHYPINTVGEALAGNPAWRRDTAAMPVFLDPGPTTNWDDAMQRDILAALERDGIDIEHLTDREVVETVAPWLLARVDNLNSSAYGIQFRDGRPGLVPGTEEGFRSAMHDRAGTIEDQFQHELYGRGMYYNRMTGSCTSAANYLTTCLRAVGIPTRTVRAVPLVDASDPEQVKMAGAQITHHQIRRTVLAALDRLGNSFAAHTYNEVFVGSRWRRLNYTRLGQNILDDSMGIMTHVQVYGDLAEAGIGDTWGVWVATASDERGEPFHHDNPYRALEISDRFGAHSGVENSEAADLDLTITRLYWYDSPRRPERTTMELSGPPGSGHLLLHVEGDPDQARTFYEGVDKSFVLTAAGHAFLRLEAERGYWIDSNTGLFEFYLRLPPEEHARMVPEIAYHLHAHNGVLGAAWKIDPAVTIVKPRDAAPQHEPEAPRDHRILTISRLYWANSEAAPEWIRDLALGERFLFAHVDEWFPEQDSDQLKRFTLNSDDEFLLKSEGHPDLRARAWKGCASSADGRFREIQLEIDPRDGDKIAPGARYTLHPRNSVKEYRWEVAEGVELKR